MCIRDRPDGVDPLSFNPFEAGVDAAKALEVEKVIKYLKKENFLNKA